MVGHPVTKELIGGERRNSRRYELELNLRFSYKLRGGEVRHGHGVTVDVSRRGVLFLADQAPPNGAAVELRMEWPFLLQGVCGLEVIMKGRVLRTTERGTAVTTHGYEFRTCGERSFGEAPSPGTFLVA